ncbi:uncharacterized protein MONBRDRAFT_25704 [Monosiga brevicollis MX1]|uniref:SAM domain-containing protein n=1 Tax=Monosiga brevicollis TaxID=81824 RepID=A9V066_MONBE|nr:uncharacterized protein MONBRDRAFT_25704 [Monosiga brevicollis MX1]EDQ89103.1 predicted protein [Monosiga brevicollis MX1]|eukprot:XP_001746208.1 hypothetical protein [Monosiga brevicollis MX1]
MRVAGGLGRPRLAACMGLGVVLVLVLAISHQVCATYFVDYHRHFRTWAPVDVQHWLLAKEFADAVPAAARTHLDGALLETLTEDAAVAELLSLTPLQAKRLILQVKLAIEESDRLASQDPYQSSEDVLLHPCQLFPEACPDGLSFVDGLQLFVPRLSAIFNGLCGRSMLSMPWKYRIMWLLLPHSAVLHAELDAYGLHFTLSSFLRHTLNLVAALIGVQVEVAFVAAFFSSHDDSANLRSLLSKGAACITHTLVLLSLPLDWALGWHISSLRLLLSLRDVMVLINCFWEVKAWFEEERKKAQGGSSTSSDSQSEKSQ